ncbi:FkbM family methyltransferase [Nitrosomonas sp. Nm33]|uniref:FkbM family methyltransferase n=1 Tax=Nitrosomonas sp. Nm33 TaxID=133724 RepID=UPI00089B1FD1|nr:FkbM family methyltransferase [Nitrosomonas sp. Nm33]SDY21182.1 methyltransferase, FkbM family [Nitrosomonas sp. Nm33]
MEQFVDPGRLAASKQRAFALQEEDMGFFETLIGAFYKRVVKPGDTAVDVGGNWGLHAFPLRDAVGPTGTLYVVEPMPVCALNFCKRFAADNARNAHLIPFALSNEEGPCDFFIHQSRDGLSGLAPRDVSDKYTKISSYKTLLDRVIPKASRPRFIKIDVEGFELAVLRGARETLMAARPIVVFEFSIELCQQVGEFSDEQFFHQFEDVGYGLADLFGDLVTRENLRESGHPWYFAAIPVESLAPTAELLRQTLLENT